jgi:hypothetical protein
MEGMNTSQYIYREYVALLRYQYPYASGSPGEQVLTDDGILSKIEIGESYDC